MKPDMYVSLSKFVFFVIVLSILFACNRDEQSEKTRNNNEVNLVSSLEKVYSGYNGSEKDWKKFLKCWDLTARSRSRIQGQQFGLLKFGSLTTDVDVKNLFASVNDLLPKSLMDFYIAYVSLGGGFIDASDKEAIGVYSPYQVLNLPNFSPEIAYVDPKWAIESSDEDYFRYGVDQDTATGRNSYLKDALVVAKYGVSEYELLLIYPNSVTADNEMESAILSHAYEFRTPSFAEMMRQLSILELSGKETLPPYPQASFAGSCAENILVNNVWWQ